MTRPLTLHYAPDNASLCVRLTLEELGLPYRTALVDRGTNAQRHPDYLRLNPNGLIPVLETPEGPIFETAAILLWLADRERLLFPPIEHQDRGVALKWLFFLSNTMHATLRLLFYPSHYAPGAEPVLQDGARAKLIAYLDILQAQCAEPPGFFADPDPTILDLYLAPMLRWMGVYPAGETAWFDLSRWPGLLTLAQRMESRPSARAAIEAEGLGPHPFSDPQPAQPPEGRAI